MAKQGDENTVINENNEQTQEKTAEKLAETKNTNTKLNPAQNIPKKKTCMPPIVIEGKITNQRKLIRHQGLVKGHFSIKHTNASTILFASSGVIAV